MEITAKVLREVEFRDRLRGYDTDEVDEFLEEVAVAVEELHARIAELSSQLESGPARPVSEPAVEEHPAFDDESIRRTLVLAQRTADLAIREANEEAQRLVDSARAEAEALVTQATETARRLREEADHEYQSRVSAQVAQREQLEREVRQLGALVGEERSRIADSLQTLLRYVTDNLSLSSDVLERAQKVSSGQDEGPSEAGLFDEPTAAVDQVSVGKNATAPGIPRSAATNGALANRAGADSDEELWQRWSESGTADEPVDESDPFGFNRH